MNLRSVLLPLLLPLAFTCRAQDLSRKILMTIDGKPVESGEFIRLLNKSSEPGKKADVDEYLEQFTVFKLKVADALRNGYDTTKAFRTELGGYRTQLSQSYLTDRALKEELLRAAYQRSLTELNAWHILVSVKPDALPADTLKAWTKANDIRNRIIGGESFETLARTLSDDPSAVMNNGNIGYFTVFQMIKPFEDAAYRLGTGEISGPVRSDYGYHIIRVTDRRLSRGKVKVAHIMKAFPPAADEKTVQRAKEQIDSIYSLLKGGAPFRQLARKYSDHQESAKNGGELNWFGTGEIAGDFAEAAFTLADTGTYTQPVRTYYGWHIIKLLDRKKPGTFEELRSFLESRMNEPPYTSLLRNSFIIKLKSRYNFKINGAVAQWFRIHTDSLIIKGKRNYNPLALPEGSVFTFADSRVTAKEFAGYIRKKAWLFQNLDPSSFINKLLESITSDKLIQYEDSMLEKNYPEFRYLMNEFHDGILLFNISDKKVWNAAVRDTVALKNFYDQHKNEYLSKTFDEVQGIVIDAYQKFLEDEWIKQLKTAYNVMIDNGVLDEVKKSICHE